jgi:hypothetical protein
MSELEGLELLPGMSATDMIKTGAQTLFSYLFKPLSDRVANAFREDHLIAEDLATRVIGRRTSIVVRFAAFSRTWGHENGSASLHLAGTSNASRRPSVNQSANGIHGKKQFERLAGQGDETELLIEFGCSFI